MKFSTKAIHAGQKPDPATGAVITPIYQTSTFQQAEINVHKGFEYSRTGNPTRQALEDCLAALENGKFGLTFATGLAAEHAVLATLKPGDHVLSCDDLYGGTYRLFEQIFKPNGISVSYAKGIPVEFEKAINGQTKIIWIESPTNPLLRTLDIAAICEIARKHRVKVVVDNTFPSPFFQQPLTLGADLVVHSTTKYIGGHSDLTGGAIILNDEEWYNRLKFMQNAIGAVPGPFDCWLMLRGLKTLAVRMKKHEENAVQIAEFLSKHKAVSEVYYPGLKDDPAYPVAAKQMTGFGGMVSFKLKDGNEETVNSFFRQLKVITLAESLGGVESLVCYPFTMTHGSVPEKQKEAVGITRNLVRLSVGIEDPEDLLEDLSQAL